MPGQHFWHWLDCSGVELPELPRSVLDSDTVTYLSDGERARFEVGVRQGRLRWVENGRPVDTPPDEDWIFVVAALDGQMYCHRKRTDTSPRFQHSSFLGAEAVQVAGTLECVDGRLAALSLHSGHYRPREDRDLCRFLRLLERGGCDLAAIRVDVQRIVKTARDGGGGGCAERGGGGSGGKRPKRETRKFWRGSKTVWFLEHKRLASQFLQSLPRTNSAPQAQTSPLWQRGGASCVDGPDQ